MNQSLDPRRLSYTIAEAAAATGLSDDTIYRKHHAGLITLRKCGRRTLVTAEELAALVDGFPALPRRGG